MTSTSMTSPWVRRSCTRAEDEPITLKKKACRLVCCRRQSVMIERGNLVFADLCRALKKLRDTILDSPGATKRADSRWLSSRDSETRIPSWVRQKKCSQVIWNDRVAKRNLLCSSRRRMTARRSTTSSWTVIEARLEELKWFQGSTFDTIARRNWSKIKTLSLNSLARYKNWRMKSIVWMIREIFKMLNQHAVDIPTLAINLCFSHLIQFLVACEAVP